MVPALYQLERGLSPFASTGLSIIPGDAAEQQKPDILIYYDGATNEVPTLVCPQHLKLKEQLGGLNPIEIPYDDVRRVTTVVGSNTVTKKKVKARCQIVACQENTTYGVYIQRIADPRFPVPSEKRYFDFEAEIDADCATDCTTRAQRIADKINADPNSLVVATVETTNNGATGTATITYYWLVLEDKTDNADFRAYYEGFDTYTVVTNYSSPNYTVGNLRQAYGPGFAAGKLDTVVLTATEIVFRKLVVSSGFGGTSSTASYNEVYEVHLKLCVVLTDAANTNSAAAKTALDVITNGQSTAALYLDKNC